MHSTYAYVCAISVTLFGCDIADNGGSGGTGGTGGTAASASSASSSGSGDSNVTVAMTGDLYDAVSGISSPPGFGLIEPNHQWVQEIVIPPGSILRDVKAYVDPSDNGVLPGVLPSAALWSKRVVDGKQTLLGSAQDASGDAAEYDAPHSLGPSGLGVGVDPATTTIYIIVTGEGSPSAEPVKFYGCTATYTP